MSTPRALLSLRHLRRLPSINPCSTPRNRLSLLHAIASPPLSTSLPRPAADDRKEKSAHPTKHKDRPVYSGEAVAEHVKDDERTKSGVPKDGPGAPSSSTGAGPTAPLETVSTHDLFALRNRTIVITGGGRGLGLTVAQALLETGSHVVCLDLLAEPSEEQWVEAEKLAKKKGLGIRYIALDVTDQDAVKEVMSGIFETAPPHAPVRGLFTCAGIQAMMPATSYSTSKFRQVIDVDLTGTFLCAQAFAVQWFERHPDTDGGAGGQGASIVMTGSMSGHVANLGIECAAYNASKAGVNQLAKNLAMEWSKRGIRVNSLSPGYIRTALTAAQLDEKPELQELWLRGSLLGRLSTPDEFRGPVVFLLSDASSYMTGADLLVDGGHCAT